MCSNVPKVPCGSYAPACANNTYIVHFQFVHGIQHNKSRILHNLP
jgi:hypothetical protein